MGQPPEILPLNVHLHESGVAVTSFPISLKSKLLTLRE